MSQRSEWARRHDQGRAGWVFCGADAIVEAEERLRAAEPSQAATP